MIQAVRYIELRLGGGIPLYLVKHPKHPVLLIHIGLLQDIVCFYHMLVRQFLSIRQQFSEVSLHRLVGEVNGPLHRLVVKDHIAPALHVGISHSVVVKGEGAIGLHGPVGLDRIIKAEHGLWFWNRILPA